MATLFNCDRCIDASRSHFSNVGHDQHNINAGHDQNTVAHDQLNAGRDQHIHTINLNIPESASQETTQFVLRSYYPVPRHLPPSSSTAIIASHHYHSACDLASNLIVEVVRLLKDLTKFSVDYQYLHVVLLQPLHRTLFLAGLAVRAFKDTPLGPNLDIAVASEAEQCQAILQKMVDNITCYRRILYSTPIRDLWPPFLWSASKVHALAWTLSARRESLGLFLVALNS